jgi:site-specific recombinase XerC
LTPAQYAARFAAEKALQQRRYCDAFAVWRSCRRRWCRRQQTCGGNQDACLQRALDRVPHHLQWRVRQDILEATPANIGAPERTARQYMPRDFYE